VSDIREKEGSTFWKYRLATEDEVVQAEAAEKEEKLKAAEIEEARQEALKPPSAVEEIIWGLLKVVWYIFVFLLVCAFFIFGVWLLGYWFPILFFGAAAWYDISRR